MHYTHIFDFSLWNDHHIHEPKAAKDGIAANGLCDHYISSPPLHGSLYGNDVHNETYKNIYNKLQFQIAISLFCCYLGEDFASMFLITFNQMPWVSDLSTIVVPSWVLLWASKTIRGLVAKEIRLSKWPLCGPTLAKISSDSSVTKTAKTVQVKGHNLTLSPHMGSRATTPTYNAWMT